MKILAISDKVVDFIYGPGCKQKFDDVDIVISCGDLPYYYVEFVQTTLNKPLYYVRGNHANKIEYSKSGNRTEPRGSFDLHGKVYRQNDLLIAGVEGSVRYNLGDFQYTQGEMWSHVLKLIPEFFYNKIAYGRYLDIFVSHASPRGIHDKHDPAHVGVNAFLWLIKTFKPKYHFHGHIHRYHHEDPHESKFQDTIVVNAYAYRVLDIPPFS